VSTAPQDVIKGVLKGDSPSLRSLRWDGGRRRRLAFDYYREHQVPIRVARIFNTYGPRMALDDGRVVSNFVAQALRGEDLTVYGDGQQTRSFQYVSDLVAGLVSLMESEHTGPFNIGASSSSPPVVRREL